MFKKLLLVAVIGGLAFAAIKGTRTFRHVKEEVASLENWVDSKIPFEKKVAQLRKEVAALDRDTDRVADELAHAIVNTRYTAADLKQAQADFTAENKKVLAMADTIKDATEKVHYGTVMVSVPEAKQRLSADVKRVVARKHNVETLQHTLAAQERIKETLQKQLETLKVQKTVLAAEIDGLEAEYKDLQLKQMESKFQFDDTRLARIKERIREMRKDIDVKAEHLNLKPQVNEEATGAPATGLSVDEILAPLNGKKAGDEKKLD